MSEKYQPDPCPRGTQQSISEASTEWNVTRVTLLPSNDMMSWRAPFTHARGCRGEGGRVRNRRAMKMSNAREERFLIDRGTDAKWASRTSWGEESYVKVASTLSNNGYSTT